MKNRNTFILQSLIIIMVVMMFYGCETSKLGDVIDFKSNVDSIIIYAYDFENNTTMRNWAYKGEELESISDYFSGLQGERLDERPSLNQNKVMYGIEINEKNRGESKTLLISGEYAITVDGEVYRIDSSETEKMCQSLNDKLGSLNNLFIINHRAISLRDGKWIENYLVPTEFDYESSDKVMLIGDKLITDKTDKFDFRVINNSDQTIEYGARVRLEAYLNDVWYQIDDVHKGNIDLAWNSSLYLLASNDEKNLTYHMSFFQPLPKGKYRILKDYNYADTIDVEYMFGEFEIK